MSRETRAMQDDDTANPGMLSVLDGEALWNKKGGRRAKILRRLPWRRDDEHERRGGALSGFRHSAAGGRSVPQRINFAAARTRKRRRFPLESRMAGAHRPLSGSNRAACRSRRRTMHGSRPLRRRPRALSSAAGPAQSLLRAMPRRQLGAKALRQSVKQGHPTGYPIYRLEWQGMGSLQRRLRNCMFGVRAEPFAYGSEQHLALALYLRARAAGLKIETPAVRP